MNDFKELDPPTQLGMDVGGRWYIGVKRRLCEYLHRDLKLHPETRKYGATEFDGLWDTELEALDISKQYYISHGQKFSHADRHAELLGTSNNTIKSQHMVF